MKTIRFTAFSILFGLLVLASACKKETTQAVATQSGSKILVTGQDAGTGLKSTLNLQATEWVITTDKVGIYSAEARTTSGGAIAIVNAQFSAAASGPSSAFTGEMYWGAASTDHTFYAYYPYSGSAGSPDATVVPVSLATAQTQSIKNNSNHIGAQTGALDFMIATPVTVTSSSNITANPLSSNPVNLRYNHLFTIIEFQIKGSGPLAKVRLSGSNTLAFSGGTISIEQTPPATGAAYIFASPGTTQTQVEVTLTSPATLTVTETETKVYMIINPGIQTGNCVIGLSTDGTAWKYISKAAPTGGFLRGNKYVVSVDASTALSIGDSYQGGKIFYFLQPGDPGYVSGEIHGLIATTIDQSTSIMWSVFDYINTAVPGTLTTLGSGKANTNKIIAQNGADITYAAGICDAWVNTDTGTGVYSDWYLPSKDELAKLYLNKDAVGGFASAYYWSSSEYYNAKAWGQDFSYSTQSDEYKGGEGSVRTIRSF
jgi:hypothetical protein